MSFYLFSEKTDVLEDKMERKMRTSYAPRVLVGDPDSNLNRADHQPHAFDEYWRSEISKPLKFIFDPSVHSETYMKEKQREKEEQQELVRDLNTVYDEPSDDVPTSVLKKGKRK